MSTVGFLILHGFAGDVHEVLPLARYLHEQGYVIECPTLEGHGLGRRFLARSTRQQWVRSAEEAYKRLQMRAETIIVIGFSMGGLLAFHVARKYPVQLLFTINTPYKYWDLKQVWRNLRKDPAMHLSRYWRSTRKIPLRSMLQFRRLLAETKPLLPEVTCPYVILQGKEDDTVKAISAVHLQKQVGSSQVTVQYFAHSGHLLLQGTEAAEAIRFIDEQVKRYLADNLPEG
ncbi:alpha/beta hydrolase [Brevibacillus fulvus]|uniref:Carboxylesterase n=1 Tax=Brevibacillus fulvus TaxID=1125967 RepID=A0A938XVT5_9BACL|nr:carboxylesterase [Brevibacillus fulvus]